MWIVIVMSIIIILLIISIGAAISRINELEELVQFKPYNTMHIDHQHKMVHLTVSGKLNQEQKDILERNYQSYVDDGYRVTVFDDTFTLRIETKE